MIPESERALSGLLRRLLRHGRVPAREFENLTIAPGEMGLLVERGEVVAPRDTQMLDTGRIRAALSPAEHAWVRDLRVFPAIDSTNMRMVEAAHSKSVDGCCWFAELQTAGRGRRGRSWHSPFARNLMVSIGVAVGGLPKEAGALSLAVGLAVADLIERLGVRNVALKWPNDVLIDGAKVCGILIELAARRRPLECVIGIGLNLHAPGALREVVDQEITGLAECGVGQDRESIAAELISNVLRFVNEFTSNGFAAMQTAYEAVHICHGQLARVVLGNGSYEGTVLGVTADGELRIRGADGERRFYGGEVSLRKHA